MKPVYRMLAHPLTEGLDIDDPQTTELRRQIIKSKLFLRRIYDEWYRSMAAEAPGPGAEGILEIGSGGGFLREFIPDLITSDILPCSGVDRVFDACARLPFDNDSLKAVLMLNTFHHLPDPQAFLADCSRCLRPGGRLIMIEPWVSNLSRFVFNHLHHEPFDPAMQEWKRALDGPLSGANGALPWIVFGRDSQRLQHLFPEFEITRLAPTMPICYLLSGGVSMRALMPGFMYAPVRCIEKLVQPFCHYLAMFALICLDKRR